jgi:hypothetical protein
VIWNKNLDMLRAVISTECEDRIDRGDRLNTGQVAEWLVRHQPAAVAAALSDLVCQVMEQRNDNSRAARILRDSPGLAQRVSGLRQISQTLGVPLWYLLKLDDEKSCHCHAAAQFIHQLRAEADGAAAQALERLCEILRPVWDGRPNMTIREALGELEQQTDETLRRLGPDDRMEAPDERHLY